MNHNVELLFEKLYNEVRHDFKLEKITGKENIRKKSIYRPFTIKRSIRTSLKWWFYFDWKVFELYINNSNLSDHLQKKYIPGYFKNISKDNNDWAPWICYNIVEYKKEEAKRLSEEEGSNFNNVNTEEQRKKFYDANVTEQYDILKKFYTKHLNKIFENNTL